MSCSLCILNAVSIAAISNVESLGGTDSREDGSCPGLPHVPYSETQVLAIGCLIVEADGWDRRHHPVVLDTIGYRVLRPCRCRPTWSSYCPSIDRGRFWDLVTRSRCPPLTAENAFWLNGRRWIHQLGGMAVQLRALFVRGLVARPHSAITRGRVFRTFFVCHLLFLLLSPSSTKTVQLAQEIQFRLELCGPCYPQVAERRAGDRSDHLSAWSLSLLSKPVSLLRLTPILGVGVPRITAHAAGCRRAIMCCCFARHCCHSVKDPKLFKPAPF